jgi:heme/copper-type cytochrome/quinol oxidase subunit 3
MQGALAQEEFEMDTRKYLQVALPLTTLGVLFSGYLSGVRFFSNQCAFNETCPQFLGFPACYTGFLLFASLFGVTAAARGAHSQARWPEQANLAISLFGVLFAGRLAVSEWANPGISHYRLGLPTCAYGFVFFAALHLLSGYALIRRVTPPTVAT